MWSAPNVSAPETGTTTLYPLGYREAPVRRISPATNARRDRKEHPMPIHTVHRELDLPVEGMTCGSCSARVQRALQKQPGVLDAQVDFATGGRQGAYRDRSMCRA